jgi:SAM-dependent methyltransferase
MKIVDTEADRIKAIYHHRIEKNTDSKYGILRPENWIGIQTLERALLRSLAKAGMNDLSSARFLDAGCGRGGTLLRWILWGADPSKCAGVDLVEDHIIDARRRLPAAVDLRVGDGSVLSFSTGSFTVTSQFTVFSSILDEEMQRNVAREILRVTKSDGIIISYDFWLNPTNRTTRGVGVAKLRELFPGCKLSVKKITLAPPIARRLAPLSPMLCRWLEGIRIFNSHYLVVIRPPLSRDAH